jgi:flagellar hook assembly protein FlgD
MRRCRNYCLQAMIQKRIASGGTWSARQVIIAGSGMQLTDAGAVGGVELAANADQVKVTIKDANGLVMNTVNLGKLLKPGCITLCGMEKRMQVFRPLTVTTV